MTLSSSKRKSTLLCIGDAKEEPHPSGFGGSAEEVIEVIIALDGDEGVGVRCSSEGKSQGLVSLEIGKDFFAN